MKKLELINKFNRRIKEIQHYHNRFRNFMPGEDVAAATYGVIMRTQVQNLLKILEEIENEKN